MQDCKCKWLYVVLTILILVFTIWPSIVSWGNWIVIVAAIIILLGLLCCNKCKECETSKPSSKKK